MFRFWYWGSREDDASASGSVLACSRAANTHLKIPKGEEIQSHVKAENHGKRGDKKKIHKCSTLYLSSINLFLYLFYFLLFKSPSNKQGRYALFFYVGIFFIEN